MIFYVITDFPTTFWNTPFANPYFKLKEHKAPNLTVKTIHRNQFMFLSHSHTFVKTEGGVTTRPNYPSAHSNVLA
jgi:hypothetical protein